MENNNYYEQSKNICSFDNLDEIPSPSALRKKTHLSLLPENEEGIGLDDIINGLNFEENKIQYSITNIELNERVQKKKMQGGGMKHLRSQESHQTTEQIERIKADLSLEKESYIQENLKKHFAFGLLNDTQMNQVIKEMFCCSTKENTIIFEQGEQGSLFFFIDQGTVKVMINKEEQRVMSDGSCFGELALLYDAPRSATIISVTQCILWAIDRFTFQQAVESVSRAQFQENKQLIDKIIFFKCFTNEQKNDFTIAMIPQKYQKDSVIFNEGDASDVFFIIKSGTVSILKGGIKEKELQQGDCFGESALITDSAKRSRSVVSGSELVLLAISREASQTIFGDQIQKIAFQNLMRWAFENNKILKHYIPMQREKIFAHFAFKKYGQGQLIWESGSEFLGVFLEGCGEFLPSKRSIYPGQGFGSNCLLDLSQDDQQEYFKDDHKLYSVTNSIVSIISRQQMQRVVGGIYLEIKQGNENSHQNSPYFKKQSFDDSKSKFQKKQMLSNQLSEYQYLKKLGQGQFGCVNLIGKTQQELFALKSIIGSFITENSLQNYIITEQRVLQMCDFPFILNFIKPMTDQFNLCFLTEYINGCDLFDALLAKGLLTIPETQFYTAFLILTLQYLHNLGIAYRDLKPENIMITQDGYPQLIDMGCSKILLDDKGKTTRTYTLVGTPHYIAPEVIQQKGYGLAIDYWSTGVCLYEFISGGLPFGDSTDDPIEIYKAILARKLRFPKFMTDENTKLIIDILLSVAPDARIGGSFGAIKAHPWFNDFDWDGFMNQQIQPPYKPTQYLEKKDIQKLWNDNSTQDLSEVLIKQAKLINRTPQEINQEDPKYKELIKNFEFE